MMEKKEIVIVGAGGFGREVQWLLERINSEKEEWEIVGFVDDGIQIGEQVGGRPVLGGCDSLLQCGREIYAAVAIGSPAVRKSVAEKLRKNRKIRFPNLIDPSVISSSGCVCGEGNIVCAGVIGTVDYNMGDFDIINLDCTIGHDVKLQSYVTVYPGVNISGCVTVGEGTEIGTGSSIIQGISIGAQAIIGAGSVVVRNIGDACTAVGVPCRPISYSGDKNKRSVRE